jgi:hypothetical protein
MNIKIISALLAGCGFALSDWFIAQGLFTINDANSTYGRGGAITKKFAWSPRLNINCNHR